MSLSALPLRTYMAGETVLADGSKADRLLILRKGNVGVVRQGIEIARVTEPGAAKSPHCWIARTRRMCVPWQPHSFTSYIRPLYKTRPCYSNFWMRQSDARLSVLVGPGDEPCPCDFNYLECQTT